MSESSSSSSGGCSCVGLILFILMITAIGWGLPMPGGHKYNIDIFPPRIWDMNDPHDARYENGYLVPMPEQKAH